MIIKIVIMFVLAFVMFWLGYIVAVMLSGASQADQYEEGWDTCQKWFCGECDSIKEVDLDEFVKNRIKKCCKYSDGGDEYVQKEE